MLKAKRPGRRAIYFNPGGPGPTLRYAPYIADGAIATELAALRDRYDIVLVDSRGFGRSHPIPCTIFPPGRPDIFRQIWPDALIAACRRARVATSDLNAYTTSQAVDDLDELRAALGYPKLVLDGYSYGTLFSFEYMRRHPASVESAVLDGVAPPGLYKGPVEFAGAAQAAMQKLIAACRLDRTCHARFPRFAQDFEAIVHRLDRGPIAVRVRNTATKRIESVLLSKEVFSDQLRHVLYNPGSAAYVPYVIARAEAGDALPLGTMLDVVVRGLGNATDWGAFLSYTCAEEMPFISERDVAQTSAGSWYGAVRVRAQQRTCASWDVQSVSRSFITPVRSAAPVLMISGTDDPATPPRFAAQQLRYLPNGRRVVVRGASHATQLACTDRLKVRFVRAGSAKGIDTASCGGAFTRPPFATSMKGFGG